MVIQYRYETQEAIPAALRDEYEAKDGAFVLKLQGGEDVTGLKNNLANALAEKKRLQATVTAIESEKENARLAELKAKGDFEALEASWAERHARETRALKDQLTARDKAVRDEARNSAATKLAAKISTAPTLIEGYIKNRLNVETNEDGETIVRVLDDRGKASALSLTDLEQELLANKEFAPIIRASSASGGGAGSKSTGGNDGGAGYKSKKIFEMSLEEKKAFHAADPAGYRLAAEEAQKQI